MSVLAWTIYLWNDEEYSYGAAPVVTKDGAKTVFCAAQKLEVDNRRKRNEKRHQLFRAKHIVKKRLSNSMHALFWYGRKVLDMNGDIDPYKFKILESEANIRAAYSHQNINEIKPTQKFPVKEITASEAYNYKFL